MRALIAEHGRRQSSSENGSQACGDGGAELAPIPRLHQSKRCATLSACTMADTAPALVTQPRSSHRPRHAMMWHAVHRIIGSKSKDVMMATSAPPKPFAEANSRSLGSSSAARPIVAAGFPQMSVAAFIACCATWTLAGPNCTMTRITEGIDSSERQSTSVKHGSGQPHVSLCPRSFHPTAWCDAQQ